MLYWYFSYLSCQRLKSFTSYVAHTLNFNKSNHLRAVVTTDAAGNDTSSTDVVQLAAKFVSEISCNFVRITYILMLMM